MEGQRDVRVTVHPCTARVVQDPQCTLVFHYNMDDWRRIDIDALEPENHLSKQDLVPDIEPVSLQQVQATAQHVKQALSLGQFAAALQAALDTPPYTSEEQAKTIQTDTVFEVLVSIKNNHNVSEFTAFVKQLSSDQQDTLIKYIYKIMSTKNGAKHGALMLSWFEKTIEVTGMGLIVRFFSDRRTV